MGEYVLPRNEDGGIDIDAVCHDINSEFSAYDDGASMDFDAVAVILKALIANARAETKEACAIRIQELNDNYVKNGGGHMDLVYQSGLSHIIAIRNMEGPK